MNEVELLFTKLNGKIRPIIKEKLYKWYTTRPVDDRIDWKRSINCPKTALQEIFEGRRLATLIEFVEWPISNNYEIGSLNYKNFTINNTHHCMIYNPLFEDVILCLWDIQWYSIEYHVFNGLIFGYPSDQIVEFINKY